ncbi:MAG: hypothetical protein P8016_11960 [Sedimentisphaerales bacterium]
MGRRNHKTVTRLRRRRVDDSISSSFAYKHKDSSKDKDIQKQPVFTKRYFWTLSCCIIVVWILVRVFDFSLIRLSYRGLYINRPYNGLHSWLHAADA